MWATKARLEQTCVITAANKDAGRTARKLPVDPVARRRACPRSCRRRSCRTMRRPRSTPTCPSGGAKLSCPARPHCAGPGKSARPGRRGRRPGSRRRLDCRPRREPTDYSGFPVTGGCPVGEGCRSGGFASGEIVKNSVDSGPAQIGCVSTGSGPLSVEGSLAVMSEACGEMAALYQPFGGRSFRCLCTRR